MQTMCTRCNSKKSNHIRDKISPNMKKGGGNNGNKKRIIGEHESGEQPEVRQRQ